MGSCVSCATIGSSTPGDGFGQVATMPCSVGRPLKPAIVVNALLTIIVYGKSLDDAVAAPRYDQQATPEEIAFELALAPKATLEALGAYGHGVRQLETIGDVQAVMINGQRLIAVSDPDPAGRAHAGAPRQHCRVRSPRFRGRPGIASESGVSGIGRN